MLKVTIKVTLKPEKNEQGQQNIRIRIIKDRMVRYFSLSLFVSAKHFNENGRKDLRNWIRTNHYDCAGYNNRILIAYHSIEKAIEFHEKLNRPFTAEDLIKYLRQGGRSETLLGYFAEYLARRKELAGNDLGRMKTASAYESTLKVLGQYVRQKFKIKDKVTDEELRNEPRLKLNNIEKKDMQDFLSWLNDRYAPNSVSTYLSHLRTVITAAKEDELMAPERFPLKGVVPAFKRKKVERLREEDVQSLADNEIKKKHSGGNIAVTDSVHARPLALAMYLLHGARLGDAIQLRMHHYVVDGPDHRIKYKTAKNKKELNILLNQAGVELLEPYRHNPDGSLKAPSAFLFPYLPAHYDNLTPQEQYVMMRRAKNRARKQIIAVGRWVGLDKRLTPHVMRHSFADLLRRNGQDLVTIQMVLGHSDIRTTRGYMEQHDQELVDRVSQFYQNDLLSKTIVKQNEELEGND